MTDDPPLSPSSEEQIPSFSASSAAFVHHLHTAPDAHHVSLPAASGRHASVSPNALHRNLPEPLDAPLRPIVSDINNPAVSPTPSSRPSLLPRQASFSSLGESAVAGPSSLSSLSRESSRRGRPQTAPERMTDADDIDERTISSRPDNVQNNSDDSCLLLIDDEANASAVMSSVGGRGTIRSHLIGRAGSLAPSVDPPLELHDDSSYPRRTDWRTFSNAYAAGKFDPIRVPNPPESEGAPAELPSAKSSPGKSSSVLPFDSRRHSGQTGSGSSHNHSSVKTTSSSGSSILATSTLTSSTSAPTSVSTDAAGALPNSLPSAPTSSVPEQAGGLTLPESLAAHRAFDAESLPDQSFVPPPKADRFELPTYSFAAATVRMASSNLRDSHFAPFGLPSPERELLDPMASIVSSTSGTGKPESASSDPGSSRFPLSRSLSSAVPSTHLTHLPFASTHLDRLPTIQASPLNTPDDRSRIMRNGVAHARVDGWVNGGALNRIPAASAPLSKTLSPSDVTEDYFGNVPPLASVDANQDPEQSLSTPDDPTPQAVVGKDVVRSQPSSPGQDRRLHYEEDVARPSIVNASDLGHLYERFGWLPAPLPPNELARRKALYRFNILYTTKDLNFDRIAHMAKLVFNTKIVVMSLVDSESQWHKTESGLGAVEADRMSGFCGHAVLSNTDEPFVVLDTLRDWRFCRNPNVVGAPHIRFYAGAPLRTSDGYSLGTLCIIDDKPRTEFLPRSRLILKEFAAVAMREMELWRDKLQLRTRDKIQTSMEKFTRECLEIDEESSTSNAEAAAKMDQVYARAAKLVCNTLELDGCVILDIGQFEKVEVDLPEGGRKVLYRANPYGPEPQSPVLERADGFGPVSAFPVLATTPRSVPTRPLTATEHEKVSEFLRDNRDGRIFENVAPSWIRYMLPSAPKYGMVVPVYGVNQQPFAMICAYTLDKGKQFLEGYELQFLRAIGVIILSAVLRRRMVLADKAKSVLISSVSHELRTPLHGILAAAELLQDTKLDHNQMSFLNTVQTCGKSLIETVNHVLDFTKLSGKSSEGGRPIKLARVNLASLIEETVEGCWIGQRARLMQGDSEIGSFYAPPAPTGLLPMNQRVNVGKKLLHVETVIDIALREKGWMVRCEKGGLRRVLMNLVGNSLKFTKDGYVQVTLRELPHPPDATHVPVEMAVIDTGKGIGKDFLKDQLFHPFSQENPLQTGTGLGLAIVNSIVRSESVNGKVDVWSSEGVGTEIRVSFDVEVINEDEDSSSGVSISSMVSTTSFGQGYNIALLNFDSQHRGLTLSSEVLSTYAKGWAFGVCDDSSADILVANELSGAALEHQNAGKPVIFLLSFKTYDMTAVNNISRSGGCSRIIYKPVGPGSFKSALQSAVQWLENGGNVDGELAEGVNGIDIENNNVVETERPSMSRGSSGESNESQGTVSDLPTHRKDPRSGLHRRRSEEERGSLYSMTRPSMAPRGVTYHAPNRVISGDDDLGGVTGSTPSPNSPSSTISTISLADGGVMLKAAAVPPTAPRKSRTARVMVVEDNVINRRVLSAFLKKRGYEHAEAFDGSAGVELFEQAPPNFWDVILMDISMPVMNGYEATRAIRRIEGSRRNSPSLSTGTSAATYPEKGVVIPPTPVVQHRTKIFALTGLATADDKRQAFGSGVDGYLVKPVSLASLDVIFKKIGF